MAGSIHKSQFATTVKFDIDQTSLAALKSALQDVSTAASKAKFQGELTQELNDAAKAAEHLSDILTQSWNTKLNQFDLTKLNNSIRESYGSVDKLKNQLNAGGAVGANAFNKIGQAVLSTNIQLKQSNAWLDKMAITMSNTIRFGISSSIMNSFTGSIQKAYSYVQKLDKSLNDIRIVSNATAEDMNKFAKYANQAAQNLGSSTLDYTKAALIYYQQGLSEQQVKERSDITVKMAHVTESSAQEVSDQLTAIWNNFYDGSKTLEYYADVLAKLGAETASSSEEISQGLEKFAAVSKTVGLSYEYAAAALTTVTDRTRQSADVVGTAFKTLFARIQDLELGKTLDDGTSLGKYSEALAAVGINIKDQNGELKKMDNILNEMGEKWSLLQDDQKVALAQNVAGVRQYTQLMALMENWDFFKKNVDSAKNATGALQKQQETYLDSIEAHMAQLTAQAEKMYDSLLDEKAIKSFTDLLTGALKTLNLYLTGLGDGVKPLLSLMGTGTALFSKQIGGVFAKRSINKEIEKQNAANVVAQQDWVGKTAGSGAESKATKEGLKLETEYYEKIKNIREQLNEQELVEANNNLRAIGELRERISFAENWKEIATSAAGKTIENEEQIIDAIDKEREHRNSLREDILAGQKALEEYDKYVEEDPKGLHDSEDIKNIYTDPLKEMAAYRKQLDDLIAKLDDRNEAEKEQKKELEEEKKIVEEIVQKLESNNREPLTKKEEVVLLKGYNQELETTKDKLHALEGSQKGMKEVTDGTVVALKAEEEQRKNNINQLEHEKLLAKEYSDIVRGFSIVASGITAVIGLFETWGKSSEEMSSWEKIKSTIAVMAVQLPIIIKNWGTIKSAFSLMGTKVLPQLAVKLHLVSAAEVEAGMSATEMWASVLGPVAAIIAMIAVITMLTIAIVKMADKEKFLQERVEESSKALQEAREKYEELQNTISGYTDARSKIDELTEGTIEFYEAIMKSNEEAQKLIDSLHLMAGTDYTISKDGLITINEDALNNATYRQQQKIYRSQAYNNRTQADLEDYRRDLIVEAFQKEINKLAQEKNNDENNTEYFTKEQAKYILTNENLNMGSHSGQTFDFEKIDLNGLKKTMSSESEDIQKTLNENAVDITTTIKTYLPKYNASLANSRSNRLQGIQNSLYGYLDQNALDRYKNLNGGAQEQVLMLMRNKQNGAKPEDQTNPNNSMFGYIQDGKWYSPITWGANIANWIMGNPYKKSREAYAESMGYKKQEGDLWETPSGQTITEKEFKKEMDEYDIYEATNAYYSGEYKTADTFQEKIEPILKRADVVSEQKGLDETQSAYITEALLRLQNGTFDEEFANLLTNEEKKVLSQGRTVNEENPNTSRIFGSAPMLNSKLDTLLAPSDTDERSTARMKADLEDYNTTLASQAAALGTSKEALEFYGTAMYNASKETDKMDKASATTIADQYKFNKAYNGAVKVFKDNKTAIKAYDKALKNNKEISYDVADAMGNLTASLKEMGLSLSAESVSKHLKDIEKLLTGNKKQADEAYKKLKKIAQLDTLKSFFGKETAEQAEKYKYTYDQLIDAINNTDPGTKLAQNYADALGKMITDTNLTISQINELASGLNITIPVKYNVPKELKIEDKEITTKATSVLHRYTGEMPNPRYGYLDKRVTIPVDYSWVETTEDKTDHFLVPDTTNFTVNSNSQSVGGQRNTTKTSSGKSGGGGKTAEKAEKFKPDTDIYHKVNTQITKVENSLKKLQRQEEKTLGDKLLKNLQKQWSELSSQVNNYKEKLSIAEKEYNKLRKKLEKQGVTFNEDGTVSNYFEILKKKEDDIEKKRQKYNKERKKKSDKVNKARLEEIEELKKQYETLANNLNRSDELISNVIPEIKESLSGALDEQVELNIKAFDLEVNLSLDLKDAKKAWNDFKHKIINGVRDEDILDNASLAKNNLAANLNTTTKDGRTIWGGDLISQTQHVSEIMREIKLQEQGLANVFGNNTAAAYDALKEAIDRARESYSEVIEYQKELHESYLNMLDQAKDKLDKQKESYEQIGNLLEHNKRMIELTHGEKAYALLEKYYTLQKENNKNQLTTLRQQQEYYEKQLLAAKAEKETAAAALERATEGTDEWETLNNKYLETIEKFEKTKEHWTEAVQASNEALESSIEFAQESLENTINKITTIINQELTGKKAGLDHAEEEWDLINRNADQYLDKINRLQGENELESKYMDSIDKATNPNTQRKLKAAMDAELKALRDKDKLTQYDLDRANKKYQITLAQIALEEAQQNKTQMRLRRDSQGNYRYQYVADEDSIKKAKEELSSLYTDLYNFDKERYKSTLSEIESVTKEFEEKMAEVAKINDPQEREERELLLKEQYQQLLTAVQKEGEVARYNVIDSAFDDLALLENKHKEDYLAMTQEETDALMTGLIPAWGSVNAKIQDTIEPLAFVTNLMDQYKTAWENTQGEIEDYKDIIYEEEDSIEDFKDQNRDTTEGLIENNEDLINQYTTNLNTLGQMITATDELVDKYKEEYGGVKALETAYAALEAQMQKNLNVYDEYANRPGMITNANEQDQAEENEGVENKDRITDIVTPEAFLNNGIARNTLQAYLKDNGYGAEDVDLITRIKAFQSLLGIPDSGYWDEVTYNEAKRRGFDTGGYTGQWGSNNGKLAFLHQKELVLNPEDTVNILNTVALMRELAQWVGQSVFNRLAGVSAGSIGNFENSSTTLDQNVHIEATFPNVTNSNEIEEALKNLVNVASQRITK